MRPSPLIEDCLTVPFVDLGPANAAVKDEVIAGIAALAESGFFTGGPHVADFEEAFASYCGTSQCVGVASGLDALRLSLIAMGLEPGDEVIVPAQTFIATFEAVTQAGGVPVVVDVSETDYCLDADAFRNAITERTRFAIPVHLYGQLADMQSLEAIAAVGEVAMVEDACQAHGARRSGETPGRRLTAAFSFYPTKNLGAFGDAGAVVTADREFAERVRALREHGQTSKYDHSFAGYTARLDTLQALVLLAKLPFLDEWNIQRRRIAEWYANALQDVGDLRLPPVAEESEPAWHLYVVRTQQPSGLAAHLRARGVATARHYPVPPHLSAAYGHLGFVEGTFPVAEALARECLSLPMFPGMTEEQFEWTIASIREYF